MAWGAVCWSTTVCQVPCCVLLLRLEDKMLLLSLCLEEPPLYFKVHFSGLRPKIHSTHPPSFPVHWPFPLTPTPPTLHLVPSTMWRIDCSLNVCYWIFLYWVWGGSLFEFPLLRFPTLFSLCAQFISVDFISQRWYTQHCFPVNPFVTAWSVFNLKKKVFLLGWELSVKPTLHVMLCAMMIGYKWTWLYLTWNSKET